ncbi:MAG: hypothetical protein JSU73_10925 [candidate division WOR-3 bacterium]|nr:MAG: hypothetical protein JSU73_10925 [candidate division WOR-3 bacterium]
MKLGTLTTVVVVLALFFGCDRSKPPTIVSLDAEPDSIHQGGVVQLSCAAEDPDGGSVTVSWSAGLGTVDPSVGDSVEYQAPGFDAFDTVVVEVTDDEGEVADSSLVITVAEGLCGGRPEVLAVTDTRSVVCDSQRVFFRQANSIRWVSVSGTDSGVVVEFPSPAILGTQLAGYGPELYCFVDNGIEDDDTVPLDRLVRVSKDHGTVDTLLVLQRHDTPLGLAGSEAGVLVSWWQGFDTQGDSLRLHLTFLPTGGDTEELVVVGTDETERLRFTSLQFLDPEVCYLVTSTDRSSGIRAYDLSTRQERTVLDVDGRAGLLVAAGDRLFWTEPEPGRIGMVALDGSDPGYVVPEGGRAEGVDLLTAMFDRGEHLVFWSVPDDLRGVNVETGAQADDIERGVGTILALTSNDDFVFYVRSDFGFSRMYGVFIR